MSARAVPEGKFADIGDGLRVHYHEHGEGPTVLFLHGSVAPSFPTRSATGIRASPKASTTRSTSSWAPSSAS